VGAEALSLLLLAGGLAPGLSSLRPSCRQASTGIGPVAAPLSAPIAMADVQISPDVQAVLLHHSTTGSITWRVLLRPELRRARESEVVEFQKLGRKGKLLDQVISWGGGSWRSEPSRKVPHWLRSEIVGLLCARASQRAAEAASGSCAERQMQADARAMAFPSFLSAELLAAHCPGYYGRHSSAAGGAEG
jgi:hypothetical protein